jgi:putative isomerase
MRHEHYVNVILEHLAANYQRMYHEPVAQFRRPYIVPGTGYEHCLWDWDTYFASLAIAKVMELSNAPGEVRSKMFTAMQGSILNMLDFQLPNGALPASVYIGVEDHFPKMVEEYDEPNQHKPVIAQFCRLVCAQTGDSDWIRERLPDLERFLVHYDEKYRDERTGLYFWRSGAVIGVDNDPCTFGRPRNSSGSIYLNSLFIAEFEAMAALNEMCGQPAAAARHRAKRVALIEAVQKYCWDRRDRFFYSVDLQCETDRSIPWLNHGLGVFWPCIPLRLRLWTGFMPMWAGFATAEQAADLVRLHLNDPAALGCDYGIRTLAANEPMYNCAATHNPSNWLGPVWMIANYMVHRGLLQYGFKVEAQDFCAKVVNLLGRDIEEHGGMHEYYVPETGQGVMNPGFMNWNYLIANMIAGEPRLGC